MPHPHSTQLSGAQIPPGSPPLRFPAVADRRSEASMAKAEAAAQGQSSPTASRPVRCIVKLGGAAITNKGELESIDQGSLRSACEQLRQAMSDGDSPEKALGMDWSRRHGDPADPAVERGGVTSLNQEIVRALARGNGAVYDTSSFKEYHLLECHHLLVGGLPSKESLTSINTSQISEALHAGFVPVLHGDAVLDELLDCTILSGDVIIRHLAKLLIPKYVVFLTDVYGVYDRPPTDPNAVLLREIEVDDIGSWSIVKPASLLGNKNGVEISVAAHDTTGGMETKILEAAMIAMLGIDVYITKVGMSPPFASLKKEAPLYCFKIFF
ncbi:hypothetical protein PR202_gb04651 [Eleusine coracana subsp. coracana]|uniref:Aspartate/glutamate/uridylate kinase domain-containing protein n=1 Tax=Eleusine coracana subsp. coracana TaxID=191504 RepID=A0AAV5E529_ELECO|nr:hypothetical protein PR202_gb04651 [Eleusine coracana subsp. coracana]